MSRSRKRHRRAAEHAQAGKPSTASLRPQRTSKLGIAFALFFGLFLGRAFSNNLSPEALGAIDLVMFAGLAATMAMGFRRWARRTIEDRERVRRRQQRAGGPGTDREPDSAEDTSPDDPANA